MELNEFLGEVLTQAEVEKTDAPPPAATPEPERLVEEVIDLDAAEAAQPRNERGQFVAKPVETPVVEAPPPEKEQPHTVPVSVLQAERKRRQEAEARAAALESAPPPVEVKDEEFWDKPVEATRKIVAGSTQQIQATVQAIRYDIAEDAARSQFEDYDTVREAFIARHEAGEPAAVAIAQQMNGQANPARFMYEQTKRLEAVDKVGDLSAYEARIRADERAKVLIESGKRPAPPSAPRSLNAEPSAVTPSDPASFEPTPLENLVTFNNF